MWILVGFHSRARVTVREPCKGCIVHYTLTGSMPDKDLALRHDMSIVVASAYDARVEPKKSVSDAGRSWYLYDVERVAKKGYLPEILISSEMEKQP
jgi:hypothetical protein